MDFTFTEEQEAVAQAAASVFDGMVTPARVAEIERSDDRVDDELWAALARSNLLGLALPEEYGGSGLGLTEVCLVLEQQGRAVAPVPLWATVVLGALPLVGFGECRPEATVAARRGDGRGPAERGPDRGGGQRHRTAGRGGPARRRRLRPGRHGP